MSHFDSVVGHEAVASQLCLRQFDRWLPVCLKKMITSHKLKKSVGGTYLPTRTCCLLIESLLNGGGRLRDPESESHHSTRDKNALLVLTFVPYDAYVAS